MFSAKSVVAAVVAFSNDSVFGISIENDAFSNVSVFKSLHFEQLFQMSPFRSFSVETLTQKRRHHNPFSYENGVMDTKP